MSTDPRFLFQIFKTYIMIRRSLILFAVFSQVYTLGCMPKVCDGNEQNDLRACPDSDGSCGNYKGERADGEILEAVDLICSVGSTVYAPFDGEMYFWRPFGGAEGKTCADQGVRIEGSGQWQGYHVHISSIALDFFGGKVRKGEPIGKAMDSACVFASNQQHATPHIEMKLYREGKTVDPTFHLQNCMCTGQICESNSKNSLFGFPFKSDKRFNGVRGWDLECPMVEDESDTEKRAPLIYSPISGELIGRTRLTFDSNGAYSGCENDGVFIVGSEEWIGFEARIYNVRVRSDLGFGRKRIVQGEPIGTRLTCESAPDSIFLEMRYQGRVVDISDIISGNKCQLPELPQL